MDSGDHGIMDHRSGHVAGQTHGLCSRAAAGMQTESHSGHHLSLGMAVAEYDRKLRHKAVRRRPDSLCKALQTWVTPLIVVVVILAAAHAELQVLKGHRSRVNLLNKLQEHIDLEPGMEGHLDMEKLLSASRELAARSSMESEHPEDKSAEQEQTGDTGTAPSRHRKEGGSMAQGSPERTKPPRFVFQAQTEPPIVHPLHFQEEPFIPHTQQSGGQVCGESGVDTWGASLCQEENRGMAVVPIHHNPSSQSGSTKPEVLAGHDKAAQAKMLRDRGAKRSNRRHKHDLDAAAILQRNSEARAAANARRDQFLPG